MLPRLDAALVTPVTPADGAAAGAPVGDGRQAAFQRALQSLVGQTVPAEVLSKLKDGSFLVKVADNSVRMALPGDTQVGSQVPLTVLSAQPRPTFQLGNNAPGGAPTVVYTEAGTTAGGEASGLPSQGAPVYLPGGGKPAPGAAPTPAPPAQGGAAAAPVQSGADTTPALPAGAEAAGENAAAQPKPAAQSQPVPTPPAASNTASTAAAAGAAAKPGLPAGTAEQASPPAQPGDSAEAAEAAPAAPAGRAAAAGTGATTTPNPAATAGLPGMPGKPTTPATPAATASAMPATPASPAAQPPAQTPAPTAGGAAAGAVGAAGAAAADAALPADAAKPQSLAATLLGKAPLTPAHELPELGANAPQATLSSAARALTTILSSGAQAGQAAQVALIGKTALFGNAGPDTEVLAQKLHDALSQSGLFYESHVAEWVKGERPLADLMREPQMQRLLQQGGESAARPAAGGPDLSAAQMINQQLHTQEQQRVLWHGQAWPGQDMQWEVRRDQGEGRQGGGEADSGPEQIWRSGVRFRLPLLGAVSAAVTLVGDQVHIQVQTDSDGSAATLRAYAGQLESAMAAAGAQLSSLTIDRDEQPGAAP